MNVELIDENNDNINFRVEDVQPGFLNLIRIFSMDYVPTLAVEEVEFKTNDSALYDEVLAHRLGLIPISTDLEAYELKEDCSCGGEGCSQCELNITLKTTKTGTIHASRTKSEDDECSFVQEDMPIVKLEDDQDLEFLATAIMGRGEEHSKWSPGLVYYKEEPSINTEDIDLDEETKENIKTSCDDLVDISDSSIELDHEELITSRRFDGCIGSLEEAGAEISQKDDSYILTVEPWGQLEPSEMLVKAADIFSDKLDELESEL